MPGVTASSEEVARFDALADRWWDPRGPMRPLHQMNPARVAWVTSRIARKYPDPAPVRVLDIGCGAGLFTEALARRGYQVLGLDAAGEAVAAARQHAAGQNLPLEYRTGEASDVLAEGARYPVITALEVIEHVPDPSAFLAILAKLLEPGGQLFLSTLNRTPESFLTAKLGAEYLLRWLPIGTHDWRKFIAPANLRTMLGRVGLRVADIAGLVPDPLTGQWRISRSLRVNYILMAEG